ncbi:hypothetical protein [Tropicibacter alexandrii]|uniref:hypothetical protein n=1 Tax=Tropicibacter alexandrii TaxID=2267683 RepID=UPI0013E8C390|nr:hypothetical protein [Tropicibacter alexandrii]
MDIINKGIGMRQNSMKCLISQPMNHPLFTADDAHRAVNPNLHKPLTIFFECQRFNKRFGLYAVILRVSGIWQVHLGISRA